MEKFIITQDDPMTYRENIIKMWTEYLSDTPRGRLDWLNIGNPAGKAIWLFAFEEKSNDIAGFISIMPRKLEYNGKSIKAGILGDFVVPNKYRVFGPGIKLPKIALQKSIEQGFDFLYTIPNEESIKVMKRAGLTDIGHVYYLTKPLSTYRYLAKKIPAHMARLLASLADIVLRVLSRETYSMAEGIFEDTNVFDTSFDILWEKVRRQHQGLHGDHSTEYLNWRYLQNPLYDFHILTYRERVNRELLGFIVYTIKNGAIEIHDIVSLEEKFLSSLFKQTVHIAREQKLHSIFLSIFEKHIWFEKLKSMLFFDTRYEMKLLVSNNFKFANKQWSFFSGDRNI